MISPSQCPGEHTGTKTDARRKGSALVTAEPGAPRAALTGCPEVHALQALHRPLFRRRAREATEQFLESPRTVLDQTMF